MEHLVFSQIADLAEYMINRVDDKEYIVATLFFNDAVDLMKSLLMYEDVKIGSIDIADFGYNGYAKEYYVSLMDDYTLCVECAFSNGRYLLTDAPLLLLDGDVKYTIAKVNSNSECIEIEIEHGRKSETESTPNLEIKNAPFLFDDKDIDKLIDLLFM